MVTEETYTVLEFDKQSVRVTTVDAHGFPFRVFTLDSSADKEAKKGGSSTEFSSCSSELKQKRCIALLPSRHIFVDRVNFPKVKRSDILKAISFKLSTTLLDRLEELYYTVHTIDRGNRGAVGVKDKKEGEYIVTAINKKLFSEYLNLIQETQFEPSIIIPDYLALPYEAKSWSIQLKEEWAVVRYEEHLGFSVHSSQLSKALLLKAKELLLSEPITVRLISDPNNRVLGEVIKHLTKSEHYSLRLESFLRINPNLFSEKPSINFLKKSNVFSSITSEYKKYARYMAYLVGGWIGILFLGSIIQFGILTYTRHKLTQEINSIAQQLALPQNHWSQPLFIDLIKRQNLRKHPLFDLLTQIGEALRLVPMVKLQTVSYQPALLQIKIRSEEISAINVFDQILKEHGVVLKNKKINSLENNISAALEVEVK